jgi:hypothetical protein
MLLTLLENNRKVRLFGEMVAILWMQGKEKTAIRLEHLGNKIQREDRFSFFCAYPKKCFIDDKENSVMTVCNEHTKMISGSEKQLTHVFYKEIA